MLLVRPITPRDADASATFDTMMTLVGQGQTCVSAMHEIAKALVIDGKAGKVEEHFAMMAGAGRQPQHIKRDLNLFVDDINTSIRFELYHIKLKLEVKIKKVLLFTRSSFCLTL